MSYLGIKSCCTYPGSQSSTDRAACWTSRCFQDEAVARMFCWWPGMDREIESMVRGCSVCQQERPDPPPSPLQPWQWPTRPWSRLHLDFAGPFLGHMFLILIDAHSKWLEVYQMRSITSSATIEQLRTTFAQFGLQVLSFTTSCRRMGLNICSQLHTIQQQMDLRKGQYKYSRLE